MEQIIANNLRDLCTNTIVNEFLLLDLCQSKVMTEHTKDIISAKVTPLQKASEFYTYMKKRPEHNFQLLINALRDSGNDNAAEILESNFMGPGLPPPVGHDAIPIKLGSLPAPESSIVNVNSLNPMETGSLIRKVWTQPGQTNQLPQPYINEGYRGALIINVLKDRPGAEFDGAELKTTLTTYGFEAEICADLSFEGIKNALLKFKGSLEALKSQHENIGSIFVAIMSHGVGYDWFKSDDEKRLSVDLIIDEFNNTNCRILKGVPKIFLINVCRGDKVDAPQTDFTHEKYPAFQTEMDIQPSKPSWTDMLICYASYDNHVAYRQTTVGTWFIQTFCQTMKENNGMDIRDILDLVSTKIGDMTTPEGGKQICPYKNVGFVRKLYFKSVETNK